MKVSVIMDKRRETTTGENAGKFSIKIRLTYTKDKKTVQKLFPTGCYASPAEFTKIQSKNAGKDKRLQDIESAVHAMYENAKVIIRENPFVDPEQFGYELTNAGSFKSPLSLMKSYAESLRKEGRIGNAQFYNNAISSFQSYAGEHFTFGVVTPKWLMAYERAMIKKGRSITTVGMYCRALRTIFNLAQDNRKIPQSLYPFGKGKYVIPSSKGRKLALTEAQKDTLLDYKILNLLQYWDLNKATVPLCIDGFRSVKYNTISFNV